MMTSLGKEGGKQRADEAASGNGNGLGHVAI
jgi:hypothetical protein